MTEKYGQCAGRKVAKLLPRFTFLPSTVWRSRRRLANERTGCLAGRQAARQAGRQTSEQHPLPRVTQIINLAMFSRTFECGFRLETRLRVKISGNVRKRVQPYLRHEAVCLHPAMLPEPEWRVLMTWTSGEYRDPMFGPITPDVEWVLRIGISIRFPLYSLGRLLITLM